MSTTTERGPMETYIITEAAADRFYSGIHATNLLNFAREQDASYAALEDRIEKATEMVEQLQVRFARHGAYDPAETCAAVLDVLRGVER